MIRPRAPLPRRFLHVVAFVLAVALPGRVTASWRWYRRLHGGRWARGPIGGRWRPVAACPGPMWAALIGGGPVPPGVCYDEPGVGGACHCEVWP